MVFFGFLDGAEVAFATMVFLIPELFLAGIFNLGFSRAPTDPNCFLATAEVPEVGFGSVGRFIN